MRLGLVEISGTIFFQLFNTALILAIFIGIPYFIYKKYKKLEKRLDTIERDIKAILDRAE